LKKILLDSWVQAIIIKEADILNRAEYKIFTAMSGEEALKLHEVHKMDLIIADLDTPGISGDKLCAIVKKERKMNRTSVILACNDSKSDIERCKSSGADLYIIKPFDAAKLLKQICQVFNVQRRASLRSPMNVPVVGSYSLKTFFCHTVDISSTGLLIETDRILNEGKTISFLLSIPDSRQITVRGKIMRAIIKPDYTYRYGVNFDDLNTGARSVIEAFVGKQTSMN
jgi:DNA-binding response OmpR family regulator